MCQDLVCRQCDIKYSCAEPALCAAAHVCLGKELMQHPGVLAQPSFPQESAGQERPALLLGAGLMEAEFGCQGCAPGLCLLVAKPGSSYDQTHFIPAALHPSRTGMVTMKYLQEAAMRFPSPWNDFFPGQIHPIKLKTWREGGEGQRWCLHPPSSLG